MILHATATDLFNFIRAVKNSTAEIQSAAHARNACPEKQACFFIRASATKEKPARYEFPILHPGQGIARPPPGGLRSTTAAPHPRRRL